MLSSKKALSESKASHNLFRSLVFFVVLVHLFFSSFGVADSRSFAQFPPPPFKFVREKRALKLLLPEEPAVHEIPFWRSKKAVHRKMLEDRYIAVSVSQSTLPNKMSAFDVRGAGVVHAPRESAFKTSLEFDKLTEVSSNFKSVFYDEKNGQLFLVVQALGFETRMILAIDRVIEKKRSEIQFEVVWGELKGMTGAIGFENVGDESCEVSILSHYQAEKFPLPKIFIGFAFELVTQKIAEKMRSFIEAHK